MAEKTKQFNLEKRTVDFSCEVINFLKGFSKSAINIPLINQLVRAATSIGANYCEALGASSRRDFRSKIYICKKECRETKYWLEIVAKTNPEQTKKCRELWQEAQELTMIFSKTILTLENKKQ